MASGGEERRKRAQERARAEGIETQGTRIRWARQFHGWSQARLAARLGVHQTAVSSWENDRDDMGGQNAVALAALLQLTALYIENGCLLDLYEPLRRRVLAEHPELGSRTMCNAAGMGARK